MTGYSHGVSQKFRNDKAILLARDVLSLAKPQMSHAGSLFNSRFISHLMSLQLNIHLQSQRIIQQSKWTLHHLLFLI